MLPKRHPCAHLPAAPQPDGCSCCWLYLHRPAVYQLRYDGPSAASPERPAKPAGAARPRRPGPCFHLGPVIDRLGTTCQKCWVHQCEVHGRCTRVTPKAGVRCCAGCPDYDPEG